MKNLLIFAGLSLLIACSPSPGSETATGADTTATSENPEPEFFELRTYYCYPDKLDDLLTRFSDHTMALFEKHGMVNLGYWLPMDNSENKLVYLLGYQSREQRDKAWDAFMQDPEWNRVWEASKVNGPLVDSVANWFLNYTAYSPRLELKDVSPRVFSLRTYYTHQGKLKGLHDRFQNHTLEIFENNGMTNVAYFGLDSGHAESANVLTYFITFPDTAARSASWKSFSVDPAWKSAYENSIKEGKLVDSLTAELMVPTSFSPLK